MATNKTRSRTFGFVLYPEEDRRHEFMLNYVMQNNLCVYITHDKDIYTRFDVEENEKKDNPNPDIVAGVIKKSHVHLIIRFDNPRSLSSVQNEYAHYVAYCEAISDYKAYIRYMLHVDINSLYEGKTTYGYNELKGSDTIISEAFAVDKKHEEMDKFTYLCNLIRDNNWSYSKLTQFVCEKDETELWDMFRKNSYHFRNLCIGK